MKKALLDRAVLFGVLSILCAPLASSVQAAADEPGRSAPAAASSATSRIVGSANAFLAALDEKQRAKVLYKFDDKEQRARWSNFPTGVVPRGGISLQEMNEAQRTAAFALVAAVLSPKGFEKVQQIREADDAFKATDHGPPHFGDGPHGGPGGPPFGNDDHGGPGGPPPGNDDHGGPGGPPPGNDDHGGPSGPPPGNDDHGGHHGPPPSGGFKPGSAMFGKDLYYISFLGTPSEKDPWMLQFGGHHLALNITIAGEQGVLTPTLTGAQPATFTVDGKMVRPLGGESDKGFALLNALDEGQRSQAILKYRVADLVLGPGHDGETIQPEGLKASAMNEKQREMLLDLISEWTGIVNDSFASARMAEIKAGLDDTWFAWSGPTTVEPGRNGVSYYRIQGPKLVIEFAPQHESDHVHTMYRDPTNDYGRAITGEAGKTSSSPTLPNAGTRTQTIVAATTAFLDSLNPDLRAKVQFDFTAQKAATPAKFKGGMNGRMTFVGEQYGQSVWSNYPVSDVPRPGLPLGSLKGTQRDAAMRLLRQLLSPKGYQKVLEIMGADQVLSDSGTPYSSGTAYYTLGIFGSPSIRTPWMLQFGGHHLGLNITIDGEQAVLTPTLTGAQPALYTANGETVRPLAQENDKAFALLDALDETQRKQAILNYRIDDLVLGPGHDGEKIIPEGLKASAMNEKQRTMLLDVISEWAGIVNDDYAGPRMAEIKAGLGETWFAWSGPTTHEEGKNGTAYYRIQGPKLIIEFSPQGVGGDPTMHVHTMYRDPTNDYGRELTAAK